MKLRKALALLCAVALVCALFTSALAAEPQEIIDLGDGFYAVITLNQTPMTRAGDIVTGSKSGTVYHNGVKVGTATLTGQFDISGSTAKATRAAITDSGMNGWSYDRGTTSCSGNKVTGTAYFSSGSNSKSLTLTLTCSPSGVIS